MDGGSLGGLPTSGPYHYVWGESTGGLVDWWTGGVHWWTAQEAESVIRIRGPPGDAQTSKTSHNYTILDERRSRLPKVSLRDAQQTPGSKHPPIAETANPQAAALPHAPPVPPQHVTSAQSELRTVSHSCKPVVEGGGSWIVQRPTFTMVGIPHAAKLSRKGINKD